MRCGRRMKAHNRHKPGGSRWVHPRGCSISGQGTGPGSLPPPGALPPPRHVGLHFSRTLGTVGPSQDSTVLSPSGSGSQSGPGSTATPASALPTKDAPHGEVPLFSQPHCSCNRAKHRCNPTRDVTAEAQVTSLLCKQGSSVCILFLTSENCCTLLIKFCKWMNNFHKGKNVKLASAQCYF